MQFAAYKDDKDARWLYHICCFLWKQVLFDDPVAKAVKKGNLKHWNVNILPKRKSLYHQPPGKGIVIGNNTSQLASNVYLDKFDRYVTMELGYARYVRYVDDFIIIVQASDYKKLKKDIKMGSQY